MLVELVILYTCNQTYCQPAIDQYYLYNKDLVAQVEIMKRQVENSVDSRLHNIFPIVDFFVSKRLFIEINRVKTTIYVEKENTKMYLKWSF
jgi:hypothetical protein